ncbi:hypothetical protein AGABI2DRAFT_115969 [Agaricus bisporus var. bisporus H97]|uniref:hypothetical protein n=1 Tax=Agaricus bisporus var. bisporus (strain H97 / ATCC MYA-4626 / FGSC 10389) TaxID=936046 RepID=UPI00029F7573|nr:hypothetical protein AGABI2DRAFT_115969 [Agaricus bisporus var. bisporus H97]EKV48923.1 hypothetical protein AGABI2DRAFT_115969 [Agaricus bisporus var. bisporus H97]
MSLDVTSSTSKDRQGIQGRPPRHSEWTRQNVFRQLSSKRRVVYDDRQHKKRRPALIRFDSTPHRSKPIFDGADAAPTIRVEDWSIFPPSRKSLAQRLSLITMPVRALRISGFIPEPRQDLLTVPATDSSGHLLLSSSNRVGRCKHVEQKDSQRTGVSTSKLALTSDLYGCLGNENLDPTQERADDNELPHSHGAREYSTGNLWVTVRNTMPAIQRTSRRYHFYSLPATGFSPLFGNDGIDERNFRAANKLNRASHGPEEVTPEDPIAEADLAVSEIDSTIPATSHEKPRLSTTSARFSRESRSQVLSGLVVPTKLPYADFGDVPYPFVFDLDLYLSEADVPATPLLLVSFSGLDSEFSSPATDYFDTPTPSPKLPVEPLSIKQATLSDIARIPYETSDSARTGDDPVPERSTQESLDNSGNTLSLHSSGVEDISFSQSEYSILTAGYVNDSITSSDIGNLIGNDLDKLILSDVEDTSSGENTVDAVTIPSESRDAGENGGVCLPEKVVKVMSSTSDEDRTRIMDQIRASFKYTSCPSTCKSSSETSQEGDTEAHILAEDTLTNDTSNSESTFNNRPCRLLEDLSFSVYDGERRQNIMNRSTLSGHSDVASFITYPTVPEVSFNNIACTPSLRVLDDVSIAAGPNFHSTLREGRLSDRRKKYHRATAPVKTLNSMLIPNVGVKIDEKLRRGIKGSQGGLEQERCNVGPVGQELSARRHRVADLTQVARRKVMPEKF